MKIAAISCVASLLTTSYIGIVASVAGAGADDVNEVCQLETMEGRCRWNSEVIVMTSAHWGRMKTGRCLKIHPNLMTLHKDDPMFLGCYEDVIAEMDRHCSGRESCTVRVGDALDNIKPCYPDQSSYLEYSYSCVKAVQETRDCVVTVTDTAQFISSSSSSSSDGGDVTRSVSSCGSQSHPWRLEAAAGQRINISLLDFAAALTATPRDVDDVSGSSCRRQYGYVWETTNKKNVSVCGRHSRQSNVYTSTSNAAEVILSSAENSASFLLEVEALGCTNVIPPDNAWLRRSNDDIIIGCYSSQQTWQLHCDGRQWTGHVGTCPELYEGTLSPVARIQKTTSQFNVLITMVAIAAGAIVLCLIVVCIGCFVFNRYKNHGGGGSLEKLQTTDVVDNNVMVEDGRLIVSSAAGPHSQRYHWTHDRQLMKPIDNTDAM